MVVPTGPYDGIRIHSASDTPISEHEMNVRTDGTLAEPSTTEKTPITSEPPEQVSESVQHSASPSPMKRQRLEPIPPPVDHHYVFRIFGQCSPQAFDSSTSRTFSKSYIDEPRSIAREARHWAQQNNGERLRKIYTDLESIGFSVVENVFEWGDPKAMVESPELKYVHVFQSVEGCDADIGDGRRKQALISPHTTVRAERIRFYLTKRFSFFTFPQNFQFIHAALSAFFRVLFPSRKMQNLVCLQSLPACARQPKHTDYTFVLAKERKAMVQARAKHDMPILAMMAVEDTSLLLWPYSHRLLHAFWKRNPTKPFNKKVSMPLGYNVSRQRLKKGSLLLFRPDLVHAGDEFQEENFRLHAYLVDPGSVLRYSPNETNILGKAASEMKEIDALLGD